MPKDAMKVLKREDLLRMLKEQEVEIARLSSDNESLRQELEESRSAGIRLDELEIETLRQNGDSIIGSIADSSLKVSGVFETAQAAADKYLDEIRTLFGRIDEIRLRTENEAKAEADEIIKAARLECESYEQRKQAVVDETWTDVKSRLDNYYEAHEGLQELLGGRPELPKSDIRSRYGNE